MSLTFKAKIMARGKKNGSNELAKNREQAFFFLKKKQRKQRDTFKYAIYRLRVKNIDFKAFSERMPDKRHYNL